MGFGGGGGGYIYIYNMQFLQNICNTSVTVSQKKNIYFVHWSESNEKSFTLETPLISGEK